MVFQTGMKKSNALMAPAASREYDGGTDGDMLMNWNFKKVGGVHRVLGGIAGMTLLFGTAGAASEADWPSKPINLVVTFSPGSGSEINARFYAKALKDALNATAIVDFKPGAEGMIGGAIAAKAPADGNTILMGSGTVNAANYPLYRGRIGYSADQFISVATIYVSPVVMFVPGNAKGDTVMDILKEAQAKGKDGQADCGSGNTVTQVACKMLAQRTGISVVSVPYKGTASALLEVAAGRLSFAFSDVAAGAPLLASGKIRAVGVSAAKRLASMPEVKTFAEQGVPDFEFLSWNGLFVPAKTPPEVVRKLNAVAVQMLRTPEYQAQQQRNGGIVVSGDLQESEKFVASEIAKWDRYVRETGVQGE
jgi:tripartite-type tricarboxylate transporter receptor subunit TctC